jgi:NADH-quinone oxidoreductase subunit N
MSAPVLWIVLPLAVAALLLIPRDERITAIAGSIFSALLALTAWLLPIDSVYTLGALVVKLSPSLEILGRRLTLTAADQPLLALVYGAAAVWFAASASLDLSRRLVPLGLGLTALLVASLAVEPFLYAALLIEMAVLVAVPMLTSPGQAPGRGALRFLIFQTFAMPFILFSGWLLAGIEANPGDLALVLQAAILLGLGFTFLLALFPFSTWIPLLAGEVPPYLAGFIFWTFPTAGLLFLVGFLERYTWLRTASALPTVLAFAGVLMVAAGGILAAFQRHLGRIMAYGAMVETGISLLALSLNTLTGAGLFLALFVPRLVSLAAWSYALTVIQQQAPGLEFRQVKGLGRAWPYASVGVALAGLALVGLPLLAGFPVRQALAEMLARSAAGTIGWIYLGSLGLMIAIVRTLAVLAMAPEGTKWEARESRPQKIILGIFWGLLVLPGLFPQWVMLIVARLPVIFQRFGQ